MTDIQITRGTASEPYETRPIGLPADIAIRGAAAGGVREFVAWLQHSDDEEPGDGSVIVVDETFAFQRTDQSIKRTEYDPALYRDVSEPGDWFALNGRHGSGPVTLGEILDTGPRASDDPPRVPHSFEVMYPASELLDLAERFIDSSPDALTMAYGKIYDLYIDRPDRSALALALGVLRDLGARIPVTSPATAT